LLPEVHLLQGAVEPSIADDAVLPRTLAGQHGALCTAGDGG
jgi:hypothetical protein